VLDVPTCLFREGLQWRGEPPFCAPQQFVIGGGADVLDLEKTLKSLIRHRPHLNKLLEAGAGTPNSAHGRHFPSSHLREVQGFGLNPGALRMFMHVPQRMASSPALVVALHGCTQNAASFDYGAGWSTLADRHGFGVVLPEQQPANNPKNCFSWFQPFDTTRGQGEALSIRQMVERAILDYGIDRRRVFVTGLSAGGAMTSVMLATYPEVFAGGAIIAGLPYGAATNVQEAFASMRGRNCSAAEWAERVRTASAHQGPWPKVSVWHGTADATVNSLNAEEVVKQWTALHGLPIDPTSKDRVNGYSRRVWCNAIGDELIESYTVNGMAHGLPLMIGTGLDRVGNAGAFFLDVGISSSLQIAKFWGLVGEPSDEVIALPSAPTEQLHDRQERFGERVYVAPAEPEIQSGAINVQAVITDALRAAGLMK
jgi:poly(hydroxyalkanoate) depolymerase family esterase